MAYKKYFTFSFDDGLQQDKRIIEILKESGLRGCTFNLNAGLLGQERVMGRLSEYGFVEKADLHLAGAKKGLVHYVESRRIPVDEIAQVYSGFEVASHTYLHQNLKALSDDELDECLSRDVKSLGKLVGENIVGFAYPFGAVSDKAVEALKRNGIAYARTTRSSRCFALPADKHRFQPTCWLGEKDSLALAESFAQSEASEGDSLMCVWGHGYELDYGTARNNWDKLKRLCEIIATADDVICCTNSEALGAARAPIRR